MTFKTFNLKFIKLAVSVDTLSAWISTFYNDYI
jgi:hypothetical protein